MPIKSTNSIKCDCGGRYTPKNKTKHMKTKKHQSYRTPVQEPIQKLDINEEDMEDTSEKATICDGCGVVESEECDAKCSYQAKRREEEEEEDTSEGADTKFPCDYHPEVLLVHTGDGDYYCSECGMFYE